MLHYSEAGNGYPVVLLHGFCENNTCFNKQVLLLKEHYNVICPELPGSGNTFTASGITMESMADEVFALLQELNIKKCVLIGHSMGGYVTLAFARKYGEMLDGFGLLHSVATADSEERRKKRDQAKEVIAEKGAAFYARQTIRSLFMEHTAEEKMKPYLEAAELFTAAGLTAQVEAMKNRPDTTSVLQQTRLPVFFGIGRFDALIPEEAMLKQAVMCGQSYVAYLSDSAHMGHVEQPELTAHHITTFVDAAIAQ